VVAAEGGVYDGLSIRLSVSRSCILAASLARERRTHLDTFEVAADSLAIPVLALVKEVLNQSIFVVQLSYRVYDNGLGK
jgi:hypothetical protein